MGTFHTECEVVNIAQPAKKVMVSRLPVDMGSELTWVPEDALRQTGIEITIFARPGDLSLLGARTLEGFGAALQAVAGRAFEFNSSLAAVAAVTDEVSADGTATSRCC